MLYQLRKCKLEFDKLTDVCKTRGLCAIRPIIHSQVSVNFSFCTYIFSADIAPDMLKLVFMVHFFVVFNEMTILFPRVLSSFGLCQEHDRLWLQPKQQGHESKTSGSSVYSQKFETTMVVNSYNMIPLPRLHIFLAVTRVHALGTDQ